MKILFSLLLALVGVQAHAAFSCLPAETRGTGVPGTLAFMSDSSFNVAVAWACPGGTAQAVPKIESFVWLHTGITMDVAKGIALASVMSLSEINLLVAANESIPATGTPARGVFDSLHASVKAASTAKLPSTSKVWRVAASGTAKTRNWRLYDPVTGAMPIDKQGGGVVIGTPCWPNVAQKVLTVDGVSTVFAAYGATEAAALNTRLAVCELVPKP